MVDFTQPFVESGLVVVAPVKTKESDAWAFLWPLTPMLWCVTGLSVIVLGAVIWILEHRFNDEFRGSPQNQIKTVIWLVLNKCYKYFFDDTDEENERNESKAVFCLMLVSFI